MVPALNGELFPVKKEPEDEGDKADANTEAKEEKL